ncbi:hypothetical protein LTR72_000268 [Exophiala xenobiotica]|nr:hypothetical protein LTR92_002978 [Exophiala xenobiotica]KAK5213412.1 hypothetical protein LTR41_000991 [Exophiala xenobiotica]KAK5231088.1 hypothetical protein LTR72_000268 [Exophiala xenobiotica]KAK5254988.1 hypothetical protein LTS06_000772 [Exophiala xenobiotica]KAK5299602.1 hypothetical protein LTR14_001816 [Exophiala xenobiotica]
MFDIMKLPVNTTLGALSRYSAARVDQYAAMVGEGLCQNFRLTMKSRMDIERAINELKVVGTLGDTLEFGFGIQDVVRLMARSERGCICLALCAALKESYSDDMAVEILLEMARLVKIDGQYMPSSQSWKDLLNACAGTLSTSRFTKLAEHLMHSAGDDRRLGAYRTYEMPARRSRGRCDTRLRTCSSPKKIAAALSELSRVSQNVLKSVTIVGGSDAAWLAALAEFLLGLSVRLTTTNGTLLYRNRDDEDFQVEVVVDISPSTEGDPILSLTGKTVVLEDVTQLFEEEGRSSDAAVVSGRVEWKHILSRSFLSEFNNLLKIGATAGECIGSAARLFKGLADAEDMFGMRYRLVCASYCDSSYGIGFVDNTIRWFPELRKLRTHMQAAAKAELNDARKNFERCLNLVRRHCGCWECQSVAGSLTGHSGRDIEDDAMADEETNQSSASRDEDDEWVPHHFCQVVILETILFLSRALSNVVLENESLLPVRSGMELTYSRQLGTRRRANIENSAYKDIGPIAFCLDFHNRDRRVTFSDIERAVEIRLQTILEIFSGRAAPSTSYNISALCCNGICAFMGVLREPNAERRCVARIHVITGRINHDGKMYTSLIDRVTPERHIEDLGTVFKLAEVDEAELNRSLSVKESSTGLECLLEMGIDRTTQWRAGPSQLAVLLASRRGMVSCELSRQRQRADICQNCSPSTIFSSEQIDKAVAEKGTLSIDYRSITLLRCQDGATAAAAIAFLASLPRSRFSVFIAERECAACFIQDILADVQEERSDFCVIFVPVS